MNSGRTGRSVLKAVAMLAAVVALAGGVSGGVSAAQPKEPVQMTLVTVEGTVTKSDGSLAVNVPVQVFRAIEASAPADTAPIRQSAEGMGRGEVVQLQRSPIRTARTDDKGVFKVQLPAGKYTYRAGTPAIGLASGELDVKPGENKKVEIKLRGGR